ncbi:uncharacterized protein LOC115746436 isoform X2 [Rhodamnia argentea]|uniref:Uncharacterized protein LOC115746436 isoform X2 n=1 Tax=Rhodamnia argentea TaxID=178133 RepID=A0ABM3H4X7_9MYRT|nr:uncharacterized protein LOC115746436 isoform X2 [Rhodamnia argentea]
MAKQANTLFLEDWLRSNSGSSSSSSGGVNNTRNASSSSSARAIIQAWAELRDCLQHQSFQPHHLQSLKTLLNSQASLHVADPQAKLLISILSSANFSLPPESRPMFLRLLYVWVRKSFRPNPVLVDSAVGVVCGIVVSARLDSDWGRLVFSEGVLVLGAFSVVPAASDASKVLCLETICRLLEQGGALMRLSEGVVANVLAGIGYALSCPVNVHYDKFVSFLLGVWGSEDGPESSIPNGLMILHLMEWVISGYINSRSFEKIRLFSQIALEKSEEKYVPYALSMAAGGVLRASNRVASRGAGLEILRLRSSAEDKMEYLASGLISRMGDPGDFLDYPMDRLLLQCSALSFARSGSLSSRAPFLICLASALMNEIFPLRRLYAKILDSSLSNSTRIRHNEVREHVESVLFKEGGAVTGIFCNLYASADEQNKDLVENLFWRYCRHLYLGHRQVVLVLQGRDNNLLGDLEKIAESAFLMVVVYALAVTKQKLTPKHSKETQMEVSVQILIAFSCLEYFRHMRLAEYLDTVRAVLPSVQENESACVSFVESIPSYTDLTVGQEYCWSTDDVQTARILFCLRVIPTCIERLLSPVLRKFVAPTMFLYMGHPNVKVALAAHALFAAFVSSGKDSFEDQRASLKEQLVFYYMQRSLELFPAITPFEGLASGVAAIVRHLPAGSPAIFYCIHSIAEKANKVCSVEFVQDGHISLKWQGESEPCKDLLELLLRLLSLVDIQVLPDLMKLLAALIVQLPKDGQNMVLNDLYAQVAESDDLTRKPTLVSWLQSLSYLCTQAKSSGSDISKISSSKKESPSLSAKAARL